MTTSPISRKFGYRLSDKIFQCCRYRSFFGEFGLLANSMSKGSVNYSLPFPTTRPGMRDEKGYQLAEIAQNQTLMVMSV